MTRGDITALVNIQTELFNPLADLPSIKPLIESFLEDGLKSKRHIISTMLNSAVNVGYYRIRNLVDMIKEIISDGFLDMDDIEHIFDEEGYLAMLLEEENPWAINEDGWDAKQRSAIIEDDVEKLKECIAENPQWLNYSLYAYPNTGIDGMGPFFYMRAFKCVEYLLSQGI